MELPERSYKNALNNLLVQELLITSVSFPYQRIQTKDIELAIEAMGT
jgi:hypothetical protein